MIVLQTFLWFGVGFLLTQLVLTNLRKRARPTDQAMAIVMAKAINEHWLTKTEGGDIGCTCGKWHVDVPTVMRASEAGIHDGAVAYCLHVAEATIERLKRGR